MWNRCRRRSYAPTSNSGSPTSEPRENESDARRAKADLDEIFDFIAADNPIRAISYVREIQDACEALIENPFMGIARPDLRNELRILSLWRRIAIAYTPYDDAIRILRVFSRGQDYEAVLGGR